MLLTDRKVKAIKPGEKLAEAVPGGRLVARRRDSGVIEFYFRTQAGGRDVMRKLGEYPETTLADAREAAGKVGKARARVDATGTFGDLLAAYVADLEAKEKASAKDVKRTLLRAIPEKAAIRRKRAAAVTPAELTDVIARRIRAGVTTEANRLRAHLHAAFAFGAKLDHDPRRPEQTARFGLTGNPASVVARIAEFERAGDPEAKRVLTWERLADYWRALEAEPPIIKATLRFHLATGGQRVQQLLRAQWTDVRDDDAIVLTDKKGKGEPRRHVVPITPLAKRELDTLRGNDRPFPITHFALSDAIARVRDRMGGETFDARDLRRSVETRLGDLNVSRETLAHLLSHGRTGVQAEHYDRAERLDQKREALDLWCAHLAAAIEKRRNVELTPAPKRQARKPRARTKA